ncbi:hypothetical protein KC19_10G121500 [Ceratodon purpureus]|uniref:Myb-like domain-containing protein n=1 Tax=Ceratodon purpureus TaxID=3225 RepID=A0A8T0GKX5_CERPU|nr:hypothetical protein KC19_10G121500 [Ceratodon purpureus]
MISNGTGDGVGPTSSHYASISNPSQMICVELNHELGHDSDENYWRKQLNINPFSPPRQCDGLAFLNWHSIGESSESMSLRSSDAANCVDRHPIQQPAPRSNGDPQGIDGNHGAAMTSNLDHAPLVSSIPDITAPGHFSAAEPLCQPLNGKACPEKLSMVELSARKDKSFTFHESYDEGSSKGKQPQHNGKDHEVARSGRPGPGILHTVRKTCAKPPRRTPRKSAPTGGKKQCVQIDADKTARIRKINWTLMETAILLFIKLFFLMTPGESWSERASEFLISKGFDRTPSECQQRWDTMKKNYDKPSRIDEGNVPAGFLGGQSLLYDLMRMIMGGHVEQQGPSRDTQSSEQLEGALAQSSAIHTDTIEFSNADGPSLPPDVPTFLSDDAYDSGQKTNSSSYASLYASVGRLWQEVGRLSQDVKTMKDRDAEILVGSYLDLTNDGSFPVE